MSAVSRFHKSLLATGILACLGGCTVGPDYKTPEAETPDAWHQELMDKFQTGESSLDSWWETLGDPVLNQIIEKARKANYDLRIAAKSFEVARRQKNIAFGGLFPDASAAASSTRQHWSENGPLPIAGETSRHNIGLDASWEIDVFGGLRRNLESTEASLQASEEVYRDVLVSLLAEVALNYIEVRTLQARLDYAVKNTANQEDSLGVVRERRIADLVGDLDIAQAESNLANTRSLVPSLRAELNQVMNRLAILVGEAPGAMHGLLVENSDIPNAPIDPIAIGMPANILRQRPDVRRAERTLAAQNALIGVAKAELYPKFLLFGDIGLESISLNSLFNSGSQVWSITPSIRWNIFSAGKIRNAIKVEEALTEQALLDYEFTVLLALEEVENALIAYVNEIERRDILNEGAVASEKSVNLVKSLYRAGLTDFQNVLDSERTLTLQQDRLAESEGLVMRRLIQLYKALGGGWTPADSLGEQPEDHETETPKEAEEVTRSEPAPGEKRGEA